MDGPFKILKFGKKEIFLPKFTIALMRTPHLSPYHAKFQVPLNFSKFDLRDYLFHAYNVRSVSIRSMVLQQPLHMYQNSTKQGQKVQLEPLKYMTVEMDRPFVWPEEPKDLKPWGGVRDAEKEMLDEGDAPGWPEAQRMKEGLSAKAKREQAAELLRERSVDEKAWEKRRSDKVIRGDEEGYKVKI